MSNTAGIDNNQVGPVFSRFDLGEAELFEQLSNLLAFVLVDFTAKGVYGKSSHNMV